MDSADNEQTELLRAIWNEMKALGSNLGSRIDKTNERLDKTNERLDKTNERLEETNARLDRTREELATRIDAVAQRQTETEMRLATQIVSLVKSVDSVRDLLRDKLDDHHRLSHLELRVDRLERKTG